MNTTPEDRQQLTAASILSPEAGSLRALLDSLRAIGQEGLSYSKNDHDTARYKKLLELASQQYAQVTGLPTDEIQAIFRKEQGSITPKIGVDVAVTNDKHEILVLKRPDGTWGMPAGWADVDESPFQTAEREALEETGLAVTPLGYIAIAHKTSLTHPGFPSQVNICVAVKSLPSDAKVTLSHEHTDYKWITNTDQIDNWHGGQKRLFPAIFAAYRDQSFIQDIHD